LDVTVGELPASGDERRWLETPSLTDYASTQRVIGRERLNQAESTSALKSKFFRARARVSARAPAW